MSSQKTSQYWFDHYQTNLLQKRVDWNLIPNLTNDEKEKVIKSIQAWQLGETSDGKHLYKAAEKYIKKNTDELYLKSIELFIKEEQKHGENLGKYLDLNNVERIKHNWGDTLFRKVRYFNTSMELWTISVITVESTAQLFYKSLKDATNCVLLKQICRDILIDEAYHIDFQVERMQIILQNNNYLIRKIKSVFYFLFFIITSVIVWFANKKVFTAGKNDFGTYMKKMTLKYRKTLGRKKNSI